AEPADGDYAPVDTSDLASPLEDVEASVDGPDAGTTAALAGDPSIPPPAPADPGGFQLPTVASGALTRPSREPAWWPAPAERAEAREVSGYFAYEGELPIPAVPPRPELDSSYRVGPAPRPAADAAEAEPVDVDMQPTAEAGEVAEFEAPSSDVDLEPDDATRQVEMPEAEVDGGEFEAEVAESGEAQALDEEAVELGEADAAFEIDEVDVDGTDAALDVAEVDIEETARADGELDELAAIDIDEPSDELEPV
ncbi:MAG: hypothetical protein GXP55_18985, partial [Deltaproteobacteria bacterium]|nr:hypothetical protein [Deltaproteobacteria bacterium]